MQEAIPLAGGARLVLAACCVRTGAADEPLTPNEVRFLAALAAADGATVEDADLAHAVYGEAWLHPSEARRLLRGIAHSVRAKAGAAAVVTIRGLGYRLGRAERRAPGAASLEAAAVLWLCP